MPKLNALINKARSINHCPSDAALARLLGVHRSAVSLWRKGGRIAPDNLASLIGLAHATSEEAALVMAEQARKRQERRMWRSLT